MNQLITEKEWEGDLYVQSIDSHKKSVLIDSTTRDIKQRLRALRNYYRDDPKLKNFFNKCQISLYENYPCKSRIDLTQRVRQHMMRCKLEQLNEKGVEYINLKKVYEDKLNIY